MTALEQPEPANGERRLAHRIRINIEKTATKGYTIATTAEIESDGSLNESLAYAAIALREADRVGRLEVARRELADREPAPALTAAAAADGL